MTSARSVDSFDSDTLIHRESPILSVKTMGPRTIRVGKKAQFEVTVQNSGNVAADGVTVMTDLPVWTDVVDHRTTAGTVTMDRPVGQAKPLIWRVGRLDAKGSRKMVLTLIPRKSEPFDLALRSHYQPKESQTRIEVQEPKLEMTLSGPHEVLHGREQPYHLQVRNTGNGEAEDVKIVLRATGNKNEPVHREIDRLAAGESKTIDVMLTEWEVGNQVIQVDAQSVGGVKAQLSEKVVVLRAALGVAIEGAELIYMDNEVTYQVVVSNSGTAVATNVVVSAELPEGVEYVSSANNGRPSADGRQVIWRVGDVAAGTQGSLSMICRLKRAGVNTIEVGSIADDGLKASAETKTLVEAMSDLGLNVVDPGRPTRVGSEATYQITVANQGTRNAENLDVVAFFSWGIEATNAEGRAHQIGPGQVIFDTIPSLGVGEKMTFKIRAIAKKAGHLSFRAEVHCMPLGTRLICEESTYFYNVDKTRQTPTRSNATAKSIRPPRTIKQLSAAYAAKRGHNVEELSRRSTNPIK